MNSVRSLGSVLVLMLLLGLPAMAGEVPTPPCSPGEMQTPPCALRQAPTEAPVYPRQLETPGVSESIDIISLGEVGLRSLFFF